MSKKLLAVLVLAGMIGPLCFANNLDVTNVTVRPINHQSTGIEFDLSWDNSWRDACNHDAVWLFAKYTTDGGTNWRHVTLKGDGVNPSGFLTGTNAGLEIAVPSDRKGAFVRRVGEGRGNLGTKGIRLVWDLDADGITSGTRARVSVQGLEMVYIPQGPFYVGDNSSDKALKVTYINTASMTNTAATGTGTLASPYTNMTSAGMGRPYGVTGVFNTNYPNGYNAFYCMKYELSRGRYLAFLNMLTTNQVTTMRTMQFNFLGALGTIGGVSNSYPLNMTNACPLKAVVLAVSANPAAPTYSGWTQYFAFTDWAGLRPLTEMEFEKACRGPALPVDRDYPWGTASRLLAHRLTNANTVAETKLDANANLFAGGEPSALQNGILYPYAPLRCGALGGETSDQFQSGASYYGVMDMAGNAFERCICVIQAQPIGSAHADSLKFNAVHGDGLLNPDGTANTTNWPYPSANSYGGGALGSRGGDYTLPSVNCAVADRFRASQTGYTSPGIRAVRTAP